MVNLCDLNWWSRARNLCVGDQYQVCRGVIFTVGIVKRDKLNELLSKEEKTSKQLYNQ